MKRREFLALAGAAGAAATWPFAGRAQQAAPLSPGMKRLAFLFTLAEADPQTPNYLTASREGLAMRGWVEGKNLSIDYRYEVTKTPEFLAQVVTEALAAKPDVVAAATSPIVYQLQTLTMTTPIVLGLAGDPALYTATHPIFGSDFIHPSGNITGFSTYAVSLGGKWAELLREISPQIKKAVYLWAVQTNPDIDSYYPAFQTAAQSIGLDSVARRVATDDEILAAIAEAAAPDMGLFVRDSPFVLGKRSAILAEIERRKVIALYSHVLFASDGAMVTYTVDQIGNFRGVGDYCGQILNGVKVVDLPVQLPTRYTLSVNLATAKAIGVTIPLTLLVRADEVIQ